MLTTRGIYPERTPPETGEAVPPAASPNLTIEVSGASPSATLALSGTAKLFISK